MGKWVAFANRNNVLLVAPVLGGSNFLDYRELKGRLIAPDRFLDAVIDGPARRAAPGLGDKFCLHGHSAGAQFAARYVIAHPSRLECAILSAPSTYAMPTEAVRWPFGMGQASDRTSVAPSSASWIAAATRVPVDVIVGSKDTEIRPNAPGQIGASRLARARAWVGGMQKLASRDHLVSGVRFTVVPGLAHDEDKMAIAAQSLLHDRYYGHRPSGS